MGGDAAPEVRQMIVDRSGGNPFFLEELAALLADSGLNLEEMSLTSTGERGLNELPATLRGLLAARLDTLTGEERSVLEDAAVMGRTGPVDALAALAANRGRPEPGPAIDSLVSKELLVIDNAECGFKS